ncbi:hypothetical protein SAMN04487977_103149 [Treponema bryantii]|uniref:Uncharacterized protein n=1 Tax=Treponema bryantii TaxID=163 RepID=A0A1H9EI24_9SPIR|nr:hypothetical protein [Treponema bryantii]SEQ24668.1 hypothetical protein SAMN04487977_103149 [Treponema bryantii]
MRLKKLTGLLNKRKNGICENAGFIGGSVTGILIGLFELYILLVYKDILKSSFEGQVSRYTGMSIDIDLLYIATIILTPLLVIIIHMLLGVLFGMSISKKLKDKKILILFTSIIIGIIFGFLTTSPISRLITVIIITITWLIFGLIQISLISRFEHKNEEQ